MKPLLLSLLLIPSITWAQSKWKTIQPVTDTASVCELLVYHMECTSCGDAEIDSGIVRIPAGLLDSKKIAGTPFYTSIVFTSGAFERVFGNKPSDLHKLVWIKCKVVDVLPSSKARGPIPVVEVYAYKQAGVKSYNTFE